MSSRPGVPEPSLESLEHYVTASSRVFPGPRRDREEPVARRLRMHVADLGRVLEAKCPDTHPPLARIVHPDVPSTTATRPSGLSAIRDAVVRGELDPIERVRQCLARIESVAHLNAYRHVDADRAIAVAEALQRSVRAGEPVGPLAGSVVAVKDSFAVAGLPMHVGSKALPVQHPEQNALVVERLMRAGAIVIGTTNMHELGYGATNVNGHFGNVGHPLDPRLTPGGSSGGSAVAVATGTADFSLGTDAAGSVRMPAALCGIVGFKPTFDALSMAGMHQLSWSLDHVGILAKSVADTLAVFQVMRGATGSAAPAQPDVAKPAIRLFEPQNHFFEYVRPDVAQAYRRAMQTLRHAGVLVEEGIVDGVERSPGIQFLTLCAEASQMNGEIIAGPAAEQLGAEVRARLEAGQFLRAVDYIKAQQMRSALLQECLRVLATADAIVTPTVVIPACVPDDVISVAGRSVPIHPTLTRCTVPFCLTGMPAVSIPCGTTEEGLPVGLQIAAAPGHDLALLDIAYALAVLLAPLNP